MRFSDLDANRLRRVAEVAAGDGSAAIRSAAARLRAAIEAEDAAAVDAAWCALLTTTGQRYRAPPARRGILQTSAR